MPRKPRLDVCSTLPLPRICSQIAHALVEDLGILYTKIARQLGVSHVAVLKMMKKEDKHE